MLTAKDFMNPSTPALSFDSTVMEAIEFFETHPQHFAAVSATKDRMQGVLTEGNLVRVFLRFQTQTSKDSLIFYRDCFEPAQLIQQSEPFAEVVKKLMTAVGNRVFVIDEAGNMIGHITTKDILPYLAGHPGKKSAGGAAHEAGMEELRSQLYLYENFFSKSPLMMHSVNHQGIIQMANEALHSVLGYSYGELIGKTIFDIYPKEIHQKAQAGIETIFNQGSHQVVQSAMVHRDGNPVQIELSSRALQDPQHNPVGTITVSRPLEMKHLLEIL